MMSNNRSSTKDGLTTVHLTEGLSVSHLQKGLTVQHLQNGLTVSHIGQGLGSGGQGQAGAQPAASPSSGGASTQSEGKK